MKRDFFILLLLITVILSTLGCSKVPSTKDNDAGVDKATQFNFVLNYGIGAKNQIDTFNGTYTKDLIPKPPLKVELSLTSKEMDKIYTKMKETEIFSYPKVFKENSNQMVTPFYTYKFKVDIDGKLKEIHWDDQNNSQSIKAKKLRELAKFIINTIERKSEYKVLPSAEGGYD